MGNRFVQALLALILCSSCAQIGSLSGGDKDVIPPQLVRSNPDTFQTNFNSKKIKLEFDEFVDIDNPRKNLLITPVLRYDPTVIASGKNVIIKNLDDSLWPNSTYVMEFNEAIKDITESNSATGFRFVFSTGDYIDSLSAGGTVRDAFTLKAEADAFVYYYENLDDSVPYLETPRYVGRTDKSGVYTIQNMKEGIYKVFVCADKNGNYKYNPPVEKMDFVLDPVKVSPVERPFLNHSIYRENPKEQFLVGYNSFNRWSFYLSYNLSVDSIYLEELSPNSGQIKYLERTYNSNRDSVVFWATDTAFKIDTLTLIVRADDHPRDTIELIFLDEEIQKKKLKTRFELAGNKLDLGKNLKINFDFPLINLNKGLIILENDSAQFPIDIKWNHIHKTMEIIADWRESTKYRLILDSGAFTDINGHSNDSLMQEVVLPKKSFYGTLDISIDVAPEASGILVVMDVNDKDLESIYLSETNRHYFEYLAPGEYRFKYIFDRNKNGRWDPGNYEFKSRPEDVYIYSGTITIRSNWDQVIEWKFK